MVREQNPNMLAVVLLYYLCLVSEKLKFRAFFVA